MEILTILLVAVALSLDAFAVSVAGGVSARQDRMRHALTLGTFFGGFQAGMPVLGWLGGAAVSGYVAGFAPWIAFILLGFAGGRMIYESLTGGEEVFNALTLSLLLALSVATSIDALAVGASLAVIGAAILVPALIIGVTTFCISAAGVVIGSRVGRAFRARRLEIVGGLILIGIGIVILLDPIP
ncbi:MAG: manganese efflux pump MntP family protein [Methanomicrobiaceae archaeon]|nr:manganese efflux pump MntP family protein [Methanomicrobiaceae archaeon]MDD5419108.1 manganese efflux pump MntP family protein [Methanomicrobiaceae archaeon]